MHSYSIDTNERRSILLILAIISIVFTWGLHKILENYQISLPWWFEAPSVLMLYGLLFKIFDKWLWQYFQKINLIKTPLLSGKWNGSLKSSFHNHSSKLEARLEIFQTWTKIKILFTTEQSKSQSETASIIMDTPEGKYLNYQYINDPEPSAIETMGIHRGAVRLLFDKNEDTLIGDYYSGRGRQNFGSLSFKRK